MKVTFRDSPAQDAWDIRKAQVGDFWSFPYPIESMLIIEIDLEGDRVLMSLGGITPPKWHDNKTITGWRLTRPCV